MLRQLAICTVYRATSFALEHLLSSGSTLLIADDSETVAVLSFKALELCAIACIDLFSLSINKDFFSLLVINLHLTVGHWALQIILSRAFNGVLGEIRTKTRRHKFVTALKGNTHILDGLAAQQALLGFCKIFERVNKLPVHKRLWLVCCR